MDSITVMIEEEDENGEKKYKLVFEFVENSLMICGDNKDKTFMLYDAKKLLPAKIIKIFEIWRCDSTYNGDNEQMIIYLNDVRYCFTNHYWD